jgi:hypothetical protein
MLRHRRHTPLQHTPRPPAAAYLGAGPHLALSPQPAGLAHQTGVPLLLGSRPYPGCRDRDRTVHARVRAALRWRTTHGVGAWRGLTAPHGWWQLLQGLMRNLPLQPSMYCIAPVSCMCSTAIDCT